MEQSCRLCQGGEDGELIRPCLCRGTIEYAHPHCLVEWIARRRSLRCEVCSAQYNVYMIKQTQGETPASPHTVSPSPLPPRPRLRTVAAALGRQVAKLSEVAVPVGLSVAFLPPTLFLMLYPFVRQPLDAVARGAELSLLVQVIVAHWIGMIILVVCFCCTFLWSAWLSWCSVHRDEVPLPFAEEQDEAGGHGGLEGFLFDLLNALEADVGDPLDDDVLRPRQDQNSAADELDGATRLANPSAFAAGAYAEAVAAGRVRLRRADVLHERRHILGVIDRTLASGRTRAFWRRRFPAYAVRIWRELLYCMCAVILVLFGVPKVARATLATALAMLSQAVGVVHGGRPHSPPAHQQASDAGGGWLPEGFRSYVLFCATVNVVVAWGVRRFAAPRLPPSQQNRLAMAYTLVRGVAMAVLLATVWLAVTTMSTLIICNDFFSDSEMPATQLSTDAAWRILREEGLSPIRCRGRGAAEPSSVTAHHRVRVVRALRFVRPNFLPAAADGDRLEGRSLFLFDRESCGATLTSLLSTVPAPRAPSGDPSLFELGTAYVRYVVYALWCLCRVESSAEEIGTVALLVLSVFVMFTAFHTRCFHGTKLYGLFERGVFHALAQLSLPSAVHIAVSGSAAIVLVIVLLGHPAWALLSLIAPTSFPILLDRLGCSYMGWTQGFVPIAGHYSNVVKLAVGQLSSALRLLFNIPPSLLEPPLLSLEHWRVPPSEAVTLVAYWLTLLAGSAIMTAIGFYLHTRIVDSVHIIIFLVISALLPVVRTVLQDRELQLHLAVQKCRAMRTARLLSSAVVLRYALGVEVSLTRPWLQLWRMPHLTARWVEEEAWAVTLRVITPTHLLSQQAALPQHLAAARAAVWQSGEAGVQRAACLAGASGGEQGTVVSFATLAPLQACALRHRPPRLTALLCCLTLLWAAPLVAGSVSAPGVRSVRPTVLLPGVLAGAFTWLWGCMVLAVSFAIERGLGRTTFSGWVRDVLPYCLFHPLSDMGHALFAPLLLRAGAVVLTRLGSEWIHALEMRSLGAALHGEDGSMTATATAVLVWLPAALKLSAIPLFAVYSLHCKFSKRGGAPSCARGPVPPAGWDVTNDAAGAPAAAATAAIVSALSPHAEPVRHDCDAHQPELFELPRPPLPVVEATSDIREAAPGHWSPASFMAAAKQRVRRMMQPPHRHASSEGSSTPRTDASVPRRSRLKMVAKHVFLFAFRLEAAARLAWTNAVLLCGTARESILALLLRLSDDAQDTVSIVFMDHEPDAASPQAGEAHV